MVLNLNAKYVQLWYVIRKEESDFLFGGGERIEEFYILLKLIFFTNNIPYFSFTLWPFYSWITQI